MQKYNEKILHETLRVAVCEVMEDTLEQRVVSSNGVIPVFSNVRKALFLMFYERHLAEVKRMSERKELRDGTAFKMMPFECSTNGMQARPNLDSHACMPAVHPDTPVWGAGVLRVGEDQSAVGEHTRATRLGARRVAEGGRRADAHALGGETTT